MNKFSLKDILSKINGPYEIINDNLSVFVDHVSPLENSKHGGLIWLSPQKTECKEILETIQASVLVCAKNLDYSNMKSKTCLILVENPKLVFMQIVNSLFVSKRIPAIHSSAIIHKNAQIGQMVSIGANCVIEQCEIGNHVIIESNCVIHENTVIRDHVIIKAGAVIGGNGFGYTENEQGEWEKFPHLGGVIIEEGVEIGSNTCIDRGSLGNTVIGKGSKIDNLVHIAHNVIVGRQTIIIAHSIIGGSVNIGDKVWIAPNVSIREGISIGSDSTIGLGAVVTKSVPPNEVWVGNPGRYLKDKLT